MAFDDKNTRGQDNSANQSGTSASGAGYGSGNEPVIRWEGEDRYWSENYGSRPYASKDNDYQRVRPAYQYGAALYHQQDGNRRFDELDESNVRAGWESYRSQQGANAPGSTTSSGSASGRYGSATASQSSSTQADHRTSGKDDDSLSWENVKDAVKDAYNRIFDRDEPGSSRTRSRQEEMA